MPFVSIRNGKLSYSVKGFGEPLVLITGFGADKEFWNSLVPALSSDFSLIAVDNRGSGDTVYDGKFTIDDMADDAIRLLDSLNIDKAHILGWSMGSQIAQAVAIGHPDRVRTLTLVSSYFRRPERSAFMLDGMMEAVEKGMPLKYFGVPLIAMGFPESYFASKRREIPESLNSDLEGMRNQMDAVNAYSTKSKIESVDVPVFSIHGVRDYMVPVEMGDELANSLKNCEKLRFEGEGHNILPSRYAEELKKFLKNHPI